MIKRFFSRLIRRTIRTAIQLTMIGCTFYVLHGLAVEHLPSL